MPIKRFKTYLIDQLQKNLEETEVTQLSRERSKIADIVFAFDNRKMLVLLNKRYKYLCSAKFEKAEKIEE